MNRIQKKFQLLFLEVTAVALLMSCNSKVFYFEQDTIKNNAWDIHNKYTYDVNIIDTVRWYNFYIDIRNTNDYQKMNIFFFVKTTFPSGAAAVDTVECMLADLSGKWLGKGSGKIYDNLFLFRENVIFPMKGNYKFEVTHGMRDSVVKGIAEIGLRIDYAR